VTDALRARWTAVAGDTPESLATYADVLARYGEPHRRYHGVRHVEHVVAMADALAGGSADAAVVLAAFLHDVVYDTRAADNEERSAAYAREHLPPLGVDAATVAEVARLVLATKAHDAADEAAALLLDADLAVLGADPATYDAYSAGVREEYGWVPEGLYRAGRAHVLRSFLDRPAVFLTEPMRRRGEAAARANLARELAALDG
jgi:predicted metal-dependent HD superfamily phosphohydrolase